LAFPVPQAPALQARTVSASGFRPPASDSSLSDSSPAAPSPLTASILLNGFSLFIHFILAAESDYHCNAPYHTSSPDRRNYRIGAHVRKLSTPFGTVPIFVPHLRFPPEYPFVPIIKRAKRVTPLIIDALSRILADGVNPAGVSALIKLPWTFEMPDELLAKFTDELIPILEKWRAAPSSDINKPFIVQSRMAAIESMEWRAARRYGGRARPQSAGPKNKDFALEEPLLAPAPVRASQDNPPASALRAPVFDSSPPAPSILLDGFSRLLHFLTEAEVDFLCVAPHHSRAPFPAERLNYRGGYRMNKIRTPVGSFPVRVPLLRYLHPRVSIIKRAKRLAPLTLDSLSHVYTDGVNSANVSALIKSLWTIELSDALLAKLTAQLTTILEKWRVQGHAEIPAA